jgi:hypothetical protein
MSDFQNQDNQFEEFEESPGGRPPGPAPRNRAFMAAVGIIGLIFVIALIILVYTLINNGSQQAARTLDQAAKINAQNTQAVVLATAEQLRINQLQQTQEALAKITPSATITATAPAVTATSVLAIPTATSLPTATVSADSATKTAAAKATSGVGGKGYPGPGTPIVGATNAAGTPGAGTPQATTTALPTTGFADEVGLPGLFGLAAVLVVVIFLARRARTH